MPNKKTKAEIEKQLRTATKALTAERKRSDALAADLEAAGATPVPAGASPTVEAWGDHRIYFSRVPNIQFLKPYLRKRDDGTLREVQPPVSFYFIGNYYETSHPMEQQAIELHPKFGARFFRVKSLGEMGGTQSPAGIEYVEGGQDSGR